MVLGHEGVGVVERVGPDVKKLKQGDRVGWGYENDSCGTCDECLAGVETFCDDRKLYGEANPDQGSFASHAIWREAFLHQIPEGMTDEAAAPLVRISCSIFLYSSLRSPIRNIQFHALTRCKQQCGGATIFTTLLGVNPGDTIGIMGVGGLGHIAIQFAAKMGCRVVVFSGSDAKKQQAFDLGAHEFIATRGATELKTKSKLNRLLVTTSAQPAWDLILPIMASRSIIYPLSVSDKPLEVPYMPLIFKGISFQGSLVATRSVHRKMLEFAAFHKIEPIVEKYPMTEEGIKTALDRLEKGQVIFRAVLIH